LLKALGSFAASAEKNFNLRRKLLNLRRKFIVFPRKINKTATQIKELVRTRRQISPHSQANYSALAGKLVRTRKFFTAYSQQNLFVFTTKLMRIHKKKFCILSFKS
jgi:hypothetical protein